MKRKFFSLFILLIATTLQAQVTLQLCRQKTRDNYPLISQYGLIDKATDYNLENASRGYLPQFSLSAKATYQSEVTMIPFEMPGVHIKALPKGQYQIMAEVQQSIWDGGAIHNKKQLLKASSGVERERLNVDMYALNERVDQLYFGILLLNEQLTQNELLASDLENTYKQIDAYLANGVANSADLDAVKVEQLNAAQKRIELLETKMAYLRMLSLFMGEELNSQVELIKPSAEISSSTGAMTIRRPELAWFEAQNLQQEAQQKSLQVGYLPKFGAFVQGAYGNPGLDMLKNEASAFYIAGVRMSWNFGSLYTLKNDKRSIGVNQERIAANRDVFLFNTRLQVAQQDGAIESIRKQMRDDDEIIRLRNNIRRAAEVKVANGVLTVTEMLREITAENMARQTKSLHQIQLLMNIWKLRNTINEE